MNNTKAFSFFQNDVARRVRHLKENNQSLENNTHTISAYDLSVIENEIISQCESLSVPYAVIDCREFNSHSEFCKKMRSLPEYSVVILSCVTEIPVSPEQNYIGYAINSLKETTYFGEYPMEHMLCYLTYRPDELVDTPTYAALKPTVPGGLMRFDKEWNIIRN